MLQQQTVKSVAQAQETFKGEEAPMTLDPPRCFSSPASTSLLPHAKRTQPHSLSSVFVLLSRGGARKQYGSHFDEFAYLVVFLPFLLETPNP